MWGAKPRLGEGISQSLSSRQIIRHRPDLLVYSQSWEIVLCWEDLVSESTLELFLIAQLDDLCIGIWISVFIIFPNERKV